MEPDATDVFGRPIIPDNRPVQPGGWSLTFGQVFWYSIALCGLYVLGKRLRMRVLVWRERQLKLQTRRRYGIPDNDLRPFNVAYADAVRRAQEEEKHNPKPRRAPPAVVDLRETSQEQTIRNRSGVFNFIS
ncbi:hypothetical protein BDN70DRAFT_598633 [Pholiota conissans]|uniref:Uncharacterized protein n=1 Tax=Pholiota conissans TaxID=109636 RepID=A0A9P5Z422_9AGAR|nr:hypothetical protein BDN70DRAFT_598633 [Pholiota conissans]